jgi:EAL domain-containing protein (putative c-di-GMP-specific phosphodiesterase class I)
VVETGSRKLAFYECLMRVHRTDGGVIHANEIIPVAERIGLVRMLDHRVLELVVNELAATPTLQASVNVSPASTVDPDWWAGLGGLLRAHASAAERLIIEITRAASLPASRISAAASPLTISVPATHRFAICASSAWISSRSTAPSCAI